MSTPTNPNELPPADVVADFIKLVSQACTDAGTLPPSFVANHRAGDQILYDSPTKEYPSTHRHCKKTGLTHARERAPLAKADYEYDVTDDKIIIIIDQDKGNVSVTNDIGNVLADIAVQQNRVHLQGYFILYRDSLGSWDEVELNGRAEFGRFVHVGGATEQAALGILRSRYGL